MTELTYDLPRTTCSWGDFHVRCLLNPRLPPLKKENLNLAKIKLYIKNTNGAFKWSSSTSSAVSPQPFSGETVFKKTIKRHGAMLGQFVHIRTDTGYKVLRTFDCIIDQHPDRHGLFQMLPTYTNAVCILKIQIHFSVFTLGNPKLIWFSFLIADFWRRGHKYQLYFSLTESAHLESVFKCLI